MPFPFSPTNFFGEKRKRFLYLIALLLGFPSILLTWRRYSAEFPFIGWSYPVLAGLVVLWTALTLIPRIPIRWTEYFVQTSLSLFYFGKYLALLKAQGVDPAFVLNELHAVFWAMAILFILGYVLADHKIALLMALGYAGAALAVAFWLLYPERYTLFLEVFRLQNRVAIIALLAFVLASVKDDLRRAEHSATLLQIAANTDSLTGLPNRRMLNALLEDQLQRSGSFCILLADVDHFKIINDTHGHDRGDETLRRIAEALRLHARESDIVGRWGGEEFLVLLFLQMHAPAPKSPNACVCRCKPRSPAACPSLFRLVAQCAVRGILLLPSSSAQTRRSTRRKFPAAIGFVGGNKHGRFPLRPSPSSRTSLSDRHVLAGRRDAATAARLLQHLPHL